MSMICGKLSEGVRAMSERRGSRFDCRTILPSPLTLNPGISFSFR
jgi:hypothetical protein